MKFNIGCARVGLVLATGAMFLALTASAAAQVQTQTSTTTGNPTQEVSVERGEVVHVSGNDVVVKMEDGSLRDFHNVPETARATVDGQEVGVHDLKPGMKLERSLTVVTTPQTITTVQTVTGKVFRANPPNNVILTLENGTNEAFTIPKDQKFTIDGQQTDAWGLKKGMKVSATKVVEEPLTVVEHSRQVTGSAPPPPMPPPADAPILIAEATPAQLPTLAAASTAPAELPKTGTILPLLGLLGSLAIVSSLVLSTIRKSL